jgi:hypothetical protein
LEQEYGSDHPSTLQAHREKAEVMREHGNQDGYRTEMGRVQEILDLLEQRETWERYDPSSILNTQPQFSPAPSAVLPPDVDHAQNDDTDAFSQTARTIDERWTIDESVPEFVEMESGADQLRLSPETLVESEPAPQPFDETEPDHIAAMLDVEGSPIVSPSARLVAGAPDLDELLGSDDEDRSSYNAGVE